MGQSRYRVAELATVHNRRTFCRSRSPDIPNPKLTERVWIEEADDLFLYRPAHRGIKPGGDLLGGVSALQETDLTGPISIFKLLP